MAYKYRYLRTMYDKIVGVAVQKPNGELIMQVGKDIIHFENDAPRIDMMHHYVETIANKPKYKPLEIWDVSRTYTTKEFVSCQKLMDEGKNFLVE